MPPLTLYYFAPSAPCRIALTTIRHLKLEVDIRVVDLFSKEQLHEGFIKINPQHTVPTLKDDEYILTESRAIAIYLIEKYFSDGHSLYPKDVHERARIDQYLQFDCGTLYPRIRAVALPVLFGGKTTISEESRKNLFDAVEILNTFLEGKQYVTGSAAPTLADLSLLASMANIFELGADLSKFTNVISWYERCQKMPENNDNLAGAKDFANKVNSLLTEKL